jgi:hypothetical protein
MNDKPPADKTYVRLRELARRAELTQAQVKRLFEVLVAYLGEDTEVRIHGLIRFSPKRVLRGEIKNKLGVQKPCRYRFVRAKISAPVKKSWWNELNPDWEKNDG